MDPENLGPPIIWTIRDVPTAIRDYLVDATPRGAKVADTLTRAVLQTMHTSAGGYASDESMRVSDKDLAALVASAAALASADLPVGVKRAAYAALRFRFRAARGAARPPTRLPAIAAP